MSADRKPVTLTVMDKDYVVGCTEEEKEALLGSVEFLNGKLREQRESGKVIGNERVAVMAALNIVHEYLEYRRSHSASRVDVGDGLERIHQKVESALARSASRSASGHN